MMFRRSWSSSRNVCCSMAFSMSRFVAAMILTSVLIVLAAADALELLVFDDAQQLGLDGQAEPADLVEKDRPRWPLESTQLAAVGPGEGTLRVPEQLRLRQSLGQRGTVEHDERAVPPRGDVVDDAGDEPLPGPRLAAQQHGGIAAGGLADGELDLGHCLGAKRPNSRCFSTSTFTAQRLVLERETGPGLFQLLVQPGVLDGDGRLIGKGLDECQVPIREEVAGLAMVDVDGAGDPLPDHQRDAEDRHDVLGDHRFPTRRNGHRRCVSGDHRLAGLDDLLDDQLGQASGATFGVFDVADSACGCARDRIGVDHPRSARTRRIAPGQARGSTPRGSASLMIFTTS